MDKPTADGSILLINPNSNAQTTKAMVDIAQARIHRFTVEGATMIGVPPIITSPKALDRAAAAVASHTVDARHKAAIVAAFGDPGLNSLRERLDVPVVGIAEASMLEAGAMGRRFAIATTTPALEQRIGERVAEYGLENQCVSIRFTKGDPFEVMADSFRLLEALTDAIKLCLHDGADAVIIGGGPLAAAARELKAHFSVPIIEPIVSAIALAERHAIVRR